MIRHIVSNSNVYMKNTKGNAVFRFITIIHRQILGIYGNRESGFYDNVKLYREVLFSVERSHVFICTVLARFVINCIIIIQKRRILTMI